MKAIVFVLLATLCACGDARAQVPHVMNYQGYLTSPGGSPVNANVTFVIKLYDVATGGTAVFSETQAVPVTSGLFTVIIGSVTPLTLPFNVPYYLGISVGADAEMTPRQALATGAYAIRAWSAASADTVADSAVTAAKIANGQVVKGVTVGATTLTDKVTLAQGNNITLTPAGNTVTIASTSGGIGGAGATNTIPLWSGGTTLGNSLITQNANGVQLPNGVQLAVGAQGTQVSFGSPNGETGMTIAGAAGRADVRFDGTTLRLVAGPPGTPPANGVAITPTSVQLPAFVSLATTPSGNNVSFGTPNSETGMVMTGPAGRADVRFDGTTLRLVAGPPASGPPANGIAIGPAGHVTQNIDGHGLVKAMLRVHYSGTIQACYNGYTSNASANC
jgi:hypothetical protein